MSQFCPPNNTEWIKEEEVRVESCLCNTSKGWKVLFNVSGKYKAKETVAAHGESFHVLGVFTDLWNMLFLLGNLASFCRSQIGFLFISSVNCSLIISMPEWQNIQHIDSFPVALGLQLWQLSLDLLFQGAQNASSASTYLWLTGGKWLPSFLGFLRFPLILLLHQSTFLIEVDRNRQNYITVCAPYWYFYSELLKIFPVNNLEPWELRMEYELTF